MSFYLDHGDDENPWKRQCTREKIVKLERELAAVTEQAECYRLKTLVMDAKIADVTAQRDALRELNASVTTERDSLLSEKDNPETTWDDTVDINKLRAELSASKQEVARLREIAIKSIEQFGCGCGGDSGLCRKCSEIYDEVSAALSSTPAPVCKCTLRGSLVGDGCEVCNPEFAAELQKADD